jgi:hypothetical protein
MNMPGFTAEASLYKASKLYHAVIESTHASGAVYPAQIALPYEPLTPEMIRPHIPSYLCWTRICGPIIKIAPGELYQECRWLNIC